MTRSLLTCMVLSFASIAAADAVPAGGWMTDCPPTRCPPGSNPYGGSHGSCSIGCAPGQVCQDHAECERYYDASFRCEPTRFCIQLVHGGHSANDVVRGECRPDDTCAQPDDGDPFLGDREPIRCETVSRCIFHEELAASAMQAQTGSTSGATDEDDGCTVGGHGAGWWLVLLLALRTRERRPLPKRDLG